MWWLILSIWLDWETPRKLVKHISVCIFTDRLYIGQQPQVKDLPLIVWAAQSNRPRAWMVQRLSSMYTSSVKLWSLKSYKSIYLILFVLLLYRTPPMILWSRYLPIFSCTNMKFWSMFKKHAYSMYMLMCLKINIFLWNCQYKHCYKYKHHLCVPPLSCFKKWGKISHSHGFVEST
jgi:hypothetical protein